MMTDICWTVSDRKKAEAFAEYVAEQVTTGSNMRGSAEYRTHLVKILTGRGVVELGGVKA